MTNLTRYTTYFGLPHIVNNVVIWQYALVFGVVLFSSNFSFAQSPSYVFVRNAPATSVDNPIIQVKWFSEEILNPEGFNLYRREVGSEWVRVNGQPITRGVMPAAIRAADNEIDFLVDVVNQAPEDLQEGFLFMNLLLKSFESNQMANFLGIFYNDTQVSFGTTYQYRVGVIQGGSESFLANSRIIRAEEYSPSPPVTEVEVYQEKKNFAVNWKQDEQSFYGVNIYSIEMGGDTSKLNKEPVILSMAPDSSGQYSYPKPMFRASGFEERKTYSFILEGTDYFGERTSFSDPFTITFDDTTPPPIPTEVRGKADSLRVLLTWEHEMVPDFKGFDIYRSSKSTGPFEKVNQEMLSVDIRDFRETLSTPGPYYYAVQAMDHSNNTIRSVPAFVDAQDVFPPAKPQGLVISSDTGKFTLKWQMNSEPDLLGYHIYRTVDSNNKGNYVLMNGDPIDTNVFVQRLPEVVKNDFYYYIVALDTSFNRSLDSEFATAVLPDVTPPEEPFIERIEYVEDGIQIVWTQNVEPDLTGYRVFRKDSLKGQEYQVNVDLLPVFSFRYIDRSAKANQDYYYAIRAYDNSGNVSQISTYSKAHWHQDIQIDEELSLKIKSRKRRKVNLLEWNTIEDSGIKGYIVFRGPSERVVKPLTGVLKSQFSFTDKVEKDTDYYYQVRAYTTSGQVITSAIIESSIN